MKRFLLVMVLSLFIGFTVSLTYQTVKTERYVHMWQTRVASLEHQEAQQLRVEYAQEYTRDLFDAARTIANENGLLCERDHKMTLYVAALQEENAKLKASLCESVEHLEVVLAENGELHQEISNLSYRIQYLEEALKYKPKPDEGDDLDEIRNDVLDILKAVQVIDEVVSVLTILL